MTINSSSNSAEGASVKPLFVGVHPRACSTAFERVFMNCPDRIKCIHEPFGDAFYYGPERLGLRYENDEEARLKSGFSDSTYRTVFEQIEAAKEPGKRLFIKDIVHYLLPPNDAPAYLAPSLLQLLEEQQPGPTTPTTPTTPTAPTTPTSVAQEKSHEKAVNNPTVVPVAILRQFQYAFLIRHPQYSIPSYYRCTIPPLSEQTGFADFRPDEAGYRELRRFLDFLLAAGVLAGEDEVVLLDADDLLDRPVEVIRQFCERVGVEFSGSMLEWGGCEATQKRAQDQFAKWKGFHEDAIHSCSLKARGHSKKLKSDEECLVEWREKYGERAADLIMATVKENLEHYEYLKKFAMSGPKQKV